jgi:hypothetical protein
VLQNSASASRQIDVAPSLDGDRCLRTLKSVAERSDASPDRGGREHMLKR